MFKLLNLIYKKLNNIINYFIQKVNQNIINYNAKCFSWVKSKNFQSSYPSRTDDFELLRGKFWFMQISCDLARQCDSISSSEIITQ